MKYSKKHVNEIIDQILDCVGEDSLIGIEGEIHFIREEHMLIDRRKSSIPEYRTEILHDFMTLKLSYKELMKKYHCSMRTVRGLLMECAEDNEWVYNEIEFRRH